MDPQSPVKKGIFFRHGQGGPAGLHTGADVADVPDPVLSKAPDQALPVLVKRLIVVMGMGIKNVFHRSALL